MQEDGHTGSDSQLLDEARSGPFRLALSLLHHGSGRGEVILHATAPPIPGGVRAVTKIEPLELLQQIGLLRYSGRCRHLGDRCCWRALADAQQVPDGIEHHPRVVYLRAAFQEFAAHVEEVLKMREREAEILQSVELPRLYRSLFPAEAMRIELGEDEYPLWVEDVKFESLRNRERQRAQIQGEIAELSRYLPLLYSTGRPLELAVVAALEALGLEAQLTATGETVDILAQTPDGLHRFAFEVTGLAGIVKKDSPKIAQVLTFEQVKKPDQKTVLLASTQNAMPIGKRSRDDFTPPVLALLGNFPVLLMTGWDLYRMVGDVIEKRRERTELVDLLYMSVGKLPY